MPKTGPLVISNFGGALTRRNTGDINSGLAKFDVSWGYDPFTKPGNLTWMEQPTSILTTASGAGNNLMLAMKARQLTSSIFNVYAIDGGGRLNQIRVDNTGTYVADVDTSSVVGTLPVGISPDVGVGIAFYGSSVLAVGSVVAVAEKIFFGDGNQNLQKINFNGSSPTSINGVSSVNSLVPRPMAEFLGKIYFGNGNNIGEIDSTELITTGQKLSPALPVGTVVKDLSVTTDGNYLQITASSAPVSENFINIDTTSKLPGNSDIFLWNGIDNGITAIEKYGNTLLTADESFGNRDYKFGHDQRGTAIYLGGEKVLSLPRALSPHASATYSSSNMLFWMVPERDQSTGTFVAALYGYGKYDEETQEGLYRFLRVSAGGGGAYEMRAVPVCIPVANSFHLPDYFGYAGDVAGTGKIYFETVENNTDTSTTGRIGRLWRHRMVNNAIGSVVAGIYETQNQVFSKKVKLGELRFYTEPLVANNSFTLGLVNSGSSVIASNTFTVGTNVTAGNDVVRWNPVIAPMQALGLRITNAGSANWTGLKCEIDIAEGGS